jgi:hypothetical protein
MLNSGKKFRALPDKKKKYSNSSVAVHIFNIPYEAMIYIYIYIGLETRQPVTKLWKRQTRLYINVYLFEN